MASHDQHGHLDATQGREVVYCHECSEEWYRDEHGLICPSCTSEAVEIVSLDNDPRDMGDGAATSSSVGSPPMMPPSLDSDDEDRPPPSLGGDGTRFIFHRSIFGDDHNHNHNHNHNHGRDSGFLSPDREATGGRSPVDPGDGEQIIGRFIQMMHDFGVGGMGGMGPPGLGAHSDRPGQTVPLRGPFGETFQTTTYTTSDGARTTLTIARGPIHPGVLNREPMAFDSVFRNTLRDIGPPPTNAGARNQPGDLSNTLQGLLVRMLSSHAANGDVVYNDAQLDNIVSALMEANPQSNAAPPASETALSKLERKKVDAKMRDVDGGKPPECTICIDEMKLDDQVIVLPCKHWFHEQCGLMWLKEHNTCPVCRTSIEQGDNNQNSSQGLRAEPAPRTHSSPPPLERAPFPFLPGLHINRDRPGSSEPPGRRERYSRSSPNMSGLPNVNETLRNLAAERERRRMEESTRSQGRRSSMSPPNVSATLEQAANSRTRMRSPSSGSRRSMRSERDGHRESMNNQGGGPLGWIREHLSRGGADRRRS